MNLAPVNAQRLVEWSIIMLISLVVVVAKGSNYIVLGDRVLETQTLMLMLLLLVVNLEECCEIANKEECWIMLLVLV